MTNRTGHIHAGSLKNPRLRRVLEFLQERGSRGATTREISHHVDVCAVNSIISELRANCIAIDCVDEGVNEMGSRTYRYRLMPAAPVQTDLFGGAA